MCGGCKQPSDPLNQCFPLIITYHHIRVGRKFNDWACLCLWQPAAWLRHTQWLGPPPFCCFFPLFTWSNLSDHLCPPSSGSLCPSPNPRFQYSSHPSAPNTVPYLSAATQRKRQEVREKTFLLSAQLQVHSWTGQMGQKICLPASWACLHVTPTSEVKSGFQTQTWFAIWRHNSRQTSLKHYPSQISGSCLQSLRDNLRWWLCLGFSVDSLSFSLCFLCLFS